MPDALPTSVPFGATARRVEWAHLPPRVRDEIERRLGAPVTEAESQGGGFTPGFASVLVDVDGRRHFVKAASLKAQRAFAESYREEVRKLRALPPGVPAPRLLWSTEVEDWLVLSTEYVDGRAPRRPWAADELDAALDLLETVADRLTPPPHGLELTTFAEDHGHAPGLWATLPEVHPDVAMLDRALVEEAAGLAARVADATAGETLVHTDVRDDNLLLLPDGSAVVCDWNWPCVGADWLDTVLLLVGPRGDGVDVEAVLGSRRLTRDVPSDDVDTVIALVTGYFWHSAAQPVPTMSPFIRDFQRWQAHVGWTWLAERRGWV